MSIANELQRIINAKKAFAFVEHDMGLYFTKPGDDTPVYVTCDENYNTNASIDELANALKQVTVWTVKEVEDGGLILVDADTGLVTAHLTLPEQAYIKGVRSDEDIKFTTQLPARGGNTITPSHSEQVAIEAGEFATGDIKVAPLPLSYKDISGTTASAWEVLEGAYFWDDEMDFVEGTMKNNGAVQKSINPLTETEVTLDAGFYTSAKVSITDDLENALAAI